MKKSQKIAILCNPYTALFELGCAVELFALARPDIPHWYKTEVVSMTTSQVSAIANIQLGVKSISSLARYDMLIVPNWNVEDPSVSSSMRRKLLAFYQQGKRIYSFCSGAFLLAELGILDGKSATTHWRYAEIFKQCYPQIGYVDDVLYLYEDQIGTSAGSASAIDLGIHIIRRDYGYKIANKVARRMVLAAHRGGSQSQFVETTVLEHPGKFSTSIDWALENLTSRINVDDLANRANMSRRTYDRKFRAALNMAPKVWLTMQRLEIAKQLLEESDQSIEMIAANSGFPDATNLRHHFRKALKQSPKKYRENFSDQRIVT